MGKKKQPISLEKIMKKLILILALLINASLAVSSRAYAYEPQAGNSAVLKANLAMEDKRAEILTCFLAQYKSPLAPYASEFIKAADTYQIDWRLVPAISGVESTFGRQIPYGSYNAYGWANGTYRFASWEESIWQVTGALRQNYVDKGAVTIAQIGRIYAPPSPFWASRVEVFMKKIASREKLILTL